jgi:hypothetical protein
MRLSPGTNLNLEKVAISVIEFTNTAVKLAYPSKSSPTIACIWEEAMLSLRQDIPLQGLKRVLETWAWRFLVIGITLILIEDVGIAGALLKAWGGVNPDLTNHFVFEIGIAFTVAAFLILSSERVLKLEMEQKFDKFLKHINAASAVNLNDLRDEFRSTLRSFNNLHRLSHFLSKVPDEDKVSKAIPMLANEILRDYATGLRAIDDGFVVEERNWWIEIMKRFYRILQEPSYNCNDKEIRVTHPGPIGIWRDLDEIQDVLSAQYDLVKQKNVSIHRIFVGAEDISPNLDDGTQHARVMNNMQELKILTYYVRRPNPTSVRDITWIPCLGVFIEWFRRPGGSIEEIKIRSDAEERRELEGMWQSLMNDVNNGKGFAAKSNAEIAHAIAGRCAASLRVVA